MANPPVYRNPLDGSEQMRVLKDRRWYLTPILSVIALFDTSLLTARIDGLAARVSALEGKPEEAAHFTASKALPALSLLGPVNVILTNLTPAKAGDVLKAGETVSVSPATPFPAGINIAAAVVTADGVVTVQLTASLSLGAGSTPIIWNITALR